MTPELEKRANFAVRLLEYQEFVTEGLTLNNDTPRERLLLAACGIGGEGGEVVDLIKKHIFHHKSEGEISPLVVEEIGDLLWYVALLVNTMGLDWNEILDVNRAKLVARYPELHPNG